MSRSTEGWRSGGRAAASSSSAAPSHAWPDRDAEKRTATGVIVDEHGTAGLALLAAHYAVFGH
jgi:hypothetical protein